MSEEAGGEKGGERGGKKKRTQKKRTKLPRFAIKFKRGQPAQISLILRGERVVTVIKKPP